MPVVPTPPTIRDVTVPSSEWNQFRDAIRFLQSPPIAKLRQTVAQTLTTGVITAITMNAEVVDTDVDGTGGHSGSSSQFVARYPGWYGAAGRVAYSSDNTGTRMVSLAVNGVEIEGARHFIEASAADLLPPSTGIAYLNAGDFLELWGYHTRGSNLNTEVANAQEQSVLNIWWISR